MPVALSEILAMQACLIQCRAVHAVLNNTFNNYDPMLKESLKRVVDEVSDKTLKWFSVNNIIVDI